MKYCSVCVARDSDRAHIATRGSGAGWDPSEWTYLCRRHHQMQGQIGWRKMIDKYPGLKNILESKGWEVCDVFGISKVRKMNNDKIG